MKKLAVISIYLLIISINGFPQIAFEKKFNSTHKTFQLEKRNFKYYELNQKSNAIFIYNIDNSLWKQINREIPENHYLGEIKFISQKTYNYYDFVDEQYTNYEIYNEFEYDGLEEVFTENIYIIKIANKWILPLFK